MNSCRGWLLVSVAVLGLVNSGAALGQVAQPATEPGAADAAATSPEGGLEEIIVTAQRRGENLQKVPISVSAVTAEMAEALGIRTSQDIIAAAPAVTFAETNSGANITIRGVGGSGSAADEAGNAVYVDGVYQAAAPALIFTLNDIERVEVAKGPQGTLFGRNSTGGVIQIITRSPSDTATGEFSLGYGNYDTFLAQAFLSGPITSNLRASISLYNEDQGKGWGTNIFDGSESYRGRQRAVRAKLVWDISPDTRAKLSYFYGDSRSPATSFAGGVIPGTLTISGGGVAGSGNVGFYNINQNADTFRRVNQHQVALTLEHDFSWAKFVNISAFLDTANKISQDSDFGPANANQVQLNSPVTTYTNETQLLSPSSSPVKWTVGLYYMSNLIELTPAIFTGTNFPPPGNFSRVDTRSKTNSYSVYGQTTVPVTDNTNITAGLRYTIDKRKLDGTTSTAVVTRQFLLETTDKKLTWRLSLDHEFSDALLGYVSYNRGYKSGLYNLATPTQPSVDPETVDAYEVGFKSQLADNRVRLNVSAFRYNFKGIQIRGVAPGGSSLILNATSAKISGVDAELSIVPTKNLTIQAAGSYLDSKYRDFKNSLFFTPRPTGGFIQSTGDATGNTSIFSPKWVGSVAVEYRIPTASAGEFSLTGSVYYNDGLFFDAQNVFKQGSYTLANAGINWSDPSDSFGIRLWARNLTKAKYYTSIAVSGSGAEYFPGAPRTYGATASYKF